MAKKYPKDTNKARGGQEIDSPSSIANASLNFLGTIQRYAWDIGGIVVMVMGLLTLLALLGLTNGDVVTWWAGLLQRWFGWGSYLFVPIAVAVGFIMLYQRSNALDEIRWGRILTLEITVFAAFTFSAVIGGSSLERASQGLDGGVVGWGLASLLGTFIKPEWLLGLFLSLVIVVSLLIGSGLFSYFGKLVEGYGAVDSVADGSETAVVWGDRP